MPTRKLLFKIFARNFRGFRKIDVNLGDVTFIVGDNSSGKTSILKLVDLLLNVTYAFDFDIFTDKAILATSHDVLSPYINSPDVTIGTITVIPADKNEFKTEAKVASYEKGPSETLILKKVVTASNNKARFIISEADAIVRKDIELSATKPNLKRILEEHDRPSKGYQKLKIPGLKRIPNLMIFGLADFDEKQKKFNLSYSPSSDRFQMRHFGPIRMDPEHAYSSYAESFDPKGRHTPNVLKSLLSARRSDKSRRATIRQLNHFGAESGMFDKLFVIPYSKSDPKAPFRIEVSKKGRRFSLDEVGYGVSQILPIIVDSIARRTSGRTLFSIQQPELHLHPKAQAAFGELLFNLAKLGMKFLVETHSDYIINRFRYCLHASKTNLETKVLFCENTKKGNVVHEVSVSSRGEIENAPSNYRTFFLREQHKLFKLI
ncbi:MAG TPA: AAA family ATPase [Hyphomicrobium sp.]|nr:AAA family ATPase [Hyphomicrobium sp.]